MVLSKCCIYFIESREPEEQIKAEKAERAILHGVGLLRPYTPQGTKRSK